VGMLHFQKLIVYQRALEFLALANLICERPPRGQSAIIDQLRRASSSVPLNIAEAAGRASRADAAHRFAVARGEATECAAALDILRAGMVIDDDLHHRGISLLTEVVAMLTKLCRPSTTRPPA